MNIKRAHCPDCHILVDMHEKKTGEFIRMTCCRCDRPLWVKNGINWRFVKDVNASAVRPPEVREIKPEPREAKPAPRAEIRGDARPAGREGRDTRPARTGRPPQDTRRGPRPAGRTDGGATARPDRRTESRPAPRADTRPPVRVEAKPEIKK
jgi:hypothetical protein